MTFSQYYTRDAGIRVGEGVFISYRQFYSEEMALEGLVGFSRDGLRIMGMREYFRPFGKVRSEYLHFMYGYGIHVGIDYTNRYKVFGRTYYHDWMWSPKFGVDGTIGFDFEASEVPLMISAAMQPYFEFSTNQYFALKPFNFVVSFKYRF